jgi:RNA polymerase sigma-70 factor, ECF subfamily
MIALTNYAPRDTVAMPPAPRQLDPERLGVHLDRLYRAAWGLCGSREDAEDLVQETYAKILSRPRLIRSEDDLGYLLRALRNTHFSRQRGAKRRLRPEPLPDDLDQIEDRSATAPHQAVVAGELYGLISGLPEGLRDAIVTVDVLGLSYREAAQALRLREITLATRLHRARLRLASLLRDNDSDSENVITTERS